MNENISQTNLFQFLDDYYKGDTDRTNYAHLLENITSSTTLGELSSYYEKIFVKLASIKMNKKDTLIYDGRYELSGWEYSPWKTYLTELNSLYNEQTCRIFNDSEHSDKFVLECLVNLKIAQNRNSIGDKIVSQSSNEVKDLYNEIIASFKNLAEIKKHITIQNYDTNDFLEYKPKYIEIMQFLCNHGYNKTIGEVNLERELKIHYFTNREFQIIIVITCIVVFSFVLFVLTNH